MTLVEFLTARLEEDEQAVRSVSATSTLTPVGRSGFLVDPERVMAEIDGKRRILAAREELADVGGDRLDEHDYTVLPALALAYSGHPEYRPSWRP